MTVPTTLPGAAVRAAPTAPPDTGARLPSSWSLGWHRGLVESRAFLRNRPAVAFNLGLPVVMMVLFGSLLAEDVPGTTVPMAQVVAVGVLATTVMGGALGTMAYGIVFDREDGTLRRLAGLPSTPLAYVIAKLVEVVVLTLVPLALDLVLGVVLFDLSLPTDPAAWLTFAWVLVLGIVTNTLLGTFIGQVLPSGRTAASLVSLPFLVLQVASGVFWSVASMPPALQQIGALFPLKWMAQGMRSVFLPEAAQAGEVAGTWELGRVALVLLAWTVAGAALVVLAWERRRRSERP